MLPLSEQIALAKKAILAKWQPVGYIPYFQAHTNTYAPTATLKALFEEALALPDVVGLSVATRADCLPDDVIALLDALSEKTVLTVELGLQTVHDETAARINRGHTFATFLDAWARLRRQAPRVRLAVHLMLGLPNEDTAMMLATVRAVAALLPDEVKLHALYVVSDAPLAAAYLSGAYQPLDMDTYVDTVVRALELLPPTAVVSRLTGDAPRGTLLAPAYAADKKAVLAAIDKALFLQNTWQGRCFSLPEG